MCICYQQDDWSTNPIFDSIHVLPSTPAANYLSNIKQLQEKIQSNLEAASQRYKQQAGKLRLQPLFQHQPTPKLSERKLGLFKIESVVLKNAFKLSLPSKWKAIHPVYVLLLDPAKSLYTGQNHPPPEPVNVQDHLEGESSCILHAILRKGKIKYLVEWAGHHSDEDQTFWEPANHLQNSPDL
ncbi:uncharacterized protein VP01_9391g1, partial [Puccinia sorghi]